MVIILFPTGKTTIMEACIRRSAIEAAANGRDCLFLVCVWQEGADALLQAYRQMVASMPMTTNLTIVVVNKSDLLKLYRVEDTQIGIETTFEINKICQNASLMETGKEVSIFIDECWVTVPKRFSAHNTVVSFLKLLTKLGDAIISGQPQLHRWTHPIPAQGCSVPLVPAAARPGAPGCGGNA
jgi:hypothetical protein